MRFFVERTCIDFNGRMYKEGETVELEAGKHNKYLRPLIDEVTAEEVAEAAVEAGDTPADAAEDTAACEAATEAIVEQTAPAKKSSRKKKTAEG